MNDNSFQFTGHAFQRIGILTLLTFFSIFFAAKQSLANVKFTNEAVSVKYINGWTGIDGEIQGAIQFKLSPGWKTYWKKPGPFGVQPTFNWTQSQNIRNVELSWPTPKAFQQDDVRIIGYENILTIPVKITKINSHLNAVLNINLEFGICSNICLLQTTKISTPLKVQAPQENLELISEALKALPSKITGEVFSFLKCSIDINDEELSVEYLINLSVVPNSKPAIIIEYTFSNNYVENQTMKLDGSKLLVNASLKNIYKDEGAIERNRLTALLILEDSGFVITGCD